MKLLALAATAALTFMASSAGAVTLTEDFEADFPAWESGWFGSNSNAQQCYGPGAGRGNNPDGLWISAAGQGCNSSAVTIAFDADFAASLTSLSLDVAGYTASVLTIFDRNGATLLATDVALTFGAFTDPGSYVRYGATSTNGIGGFSFSGSAAGNTSIDNLVAVTGAGAVPEPATWALMLIGFGAVGAGMRRQSATVRFAAA